MGCAFDVPELSVELGFTHVSVRTVRVVLCLYQGGGLVKLSVPFVFFCYGVVLVMRGAQLQSVVADFSIVGS